MGSLFKYIHKPLFVSSSKLEPVPMASAKRVGFHFLRLLQMFFQHVAPKAGDQFRSDRSPLSTDPQKEASSPMGVTIGSIPPLLLRVLSARSGLREFGHQPRSFLGAGPGGRAGANADGSEAQGLFGRWTATRVGNGWFRRWERNRSKTDAVPRSRGEREVQQGTGGGGLDETER